MLSFVSQAGPTTAKLASSYQYRSHPGDNDFWHDCIQCPHLLKKICISDLR